MATNRPSRIFSEKTQTKAKATKNITIDRLTYKLYVYVVAKKFKTLELNIDIGMRKITRMNISLKIDLAI